MEQLQGSSLSNMWPIVDEGDVWFGLLDACDADVVALCLCKWFSSDATEESSAGDMMALGLMANFWPFVLEDVGRVVIRELDCCELTITTGEEGPEDDNN